MAYHSGSQPLPLSTTCLSNIRRHAPRSFSGTYPKPSTCTYAYTFHPGGCLVARLAAAMPIHTSAAPRGVTHPSSAPIPITRPSAAAAPMPPTSYTPSSMPSSMPTTSPLAAYCLQSLVRQRVRSSPLPTPPTPQFYPFWCPSVAPPLFCIHCCWFLWWGGAVSMCLCLHGSSHCTVTLCSLWPPHAELPPHVPRPTPNRPGHPHSCLLSRRRTHPPNCLTVELPA